MATVTGSITAAAVIGYKGGIRHRFVSGVQDASDTTKVRPTNWHADHYEPAVYVYVENNTTAALAASTTVISTTNTLKAGTYRVIAHLRTSAMTQAGNPGTCFIRVASSQITDGTATDLRPTAAAQFQLYGYFAHAGGSVTVDVLFSREAGTTTFGVVGSSEARFGQKLLIERIGD